MKIELLVDYDDTEVSANRIADLVLEIPGVEGVDVGEWTS